MRWSGVLSYFERLKGESLESHVITGTDPSKPILVAIKGTVFDVSGNDAYGPNGQYHGQYSSLFNSGERLPEADKRKKNQSSPAKIPPAPSRPPHSAQKTVFRNGAIWKRNIRPCWKSGSSSSASDIISSARCRLPQTRNPGNLYAAGRRAGV